MESSVASSSASSSNTSIDINEVHKVHPPPRQTTLKKVQKKAKETFFSDDPLRQFKGQPTSRKIVLGAQYVLPILEWAPNYSLELFKSDIISGITIASLAIPQGISYAKLANLPPIVGLYSSFVPPLVYAIFGGSKHVAVGPVSIASLILGSMISEQVSFTKEPLLFLQLALSSTFFAGAFQAALGFLRLGFIIDFLSRATLTGFQAGAAMIVSLQQLKSLLGIQHFTKEMGIVQVLTSVFTTTDEWSLKTIILAICFLAFLLTTRHVSMKNPNLWWVSAGAPLLSVIVGTAAIFLTKADVKYGISVIGKLPTGLNPPSWKLLIFSGNYLPLVVRTGIVTGVISLTEGIAVGRTFSALKNYHIDGNKEMIAIGFMNIIGSSTSCYVSTGGFSRSAVNYNAGCKSAMSNIVMAITVMITLLFLMPLFQFLPNVVLGAIIVTAVIGLMDYHAAYQIYRVDKFDFLICLAAFLGTIFISPPTGLAIAVMISIFKVILQITRPKTVLLGKLPGTDIYRNIHHYSKAETVPGFLILSVKAPINFANSNYIRERISRYIYDYEGEEVNKQCKLKFVVLNLSPVSGIDSNGIQFFKDLNIMLEKKDIKLVLVNPLGEVMEKLFRAIETKDLLTPESLFLTLREAIGYHSSMLKPRPGSGDNYVSIGSGSETS